MFLLTWPVCECKGEIAVWRLISHAISKNLKKTENLLDWNSFSIEFQWKAVITTDSSSRMPVQGTKYTRPAEQEEPSWKTLEERRLMRHSCKINKFCSGFQWIARSSQSLFRIFVSELCLERKANKKANERTKWKGLVEFPMQRR